jgi:aspartyl-tRNA(Asn)/glutamyl-tRNA(Gln) amidotransferase subunit C
MWDTARRPNPKRYTLSSGRCGKLPQPPVHNAADGEDERMTAKVTVEEVERVAELAHLELQPEETPGMLNDLNAILDYVAELNQLDTTGIEPLAQISELVDAKGAGVLRADLVRPSLDRAEVFSQAPESDGVFFKVPKVIER